MRTIEIVERSSGFWLVDKTGPINGKPGPFSTYKQAVKARDSKNLCGKIRDKNDPYEVYRNSSGWEWRVLKKWQSPAKESQNPYARWFCAVKSPYTSPSYDMGDVYVNEIKSMGYKVENVVIEKW